MVTNSADIPESLDLASPLWTFAVNCWQIPGVESLCLTLQDNGWSVTRLLSACWLASRGREFTGEPATVRQWREQMTTPLRTRKKALPKQHPALAALRAQLAGTELEAERVELALAWQALRALPPAASPTDSTLALARHNLHAAGPDTHMNQEVSERIDQLVTLLFSDALLHTDW
ncbi:TIGR02444 family protein [Marinobacter sp. X15-166B]|uniref:TIGR02444 family protein n=1 Tax=Marinobacter sp. X15-166B TaxID=1897620 RepID=UPI00085CD86B|nr:TIGR02444 family protein [Marinobacter sp. X15-166B]OEY66416.1 TIGR02444 family protein [Marinobacter sp. X15-166B]